MNSTSSTPASDSTSDTFAPAFSLSRLLTANHAVNPTGIAVRHEERAMDWQTLTAHVARLASVLRDRGLQSGDRVAVLSANSDMLYALLTAIPWAGGVVVPLNTRLIAQEIADCLEDAGCRILLTDAKLAATAQAACANAPFVEHLLMMEGEETGENSLTALAAQAEPLTDQGRGDEDAAVICYTGGTTGRPKGVVLTHRSLISGALQWLSVARLDASDSLLLAAPMFHLAGLSNSYGAMLVGGTAEILGQFNPTQILALIDAKRISYAVLVPAMLKALVNHPNLHQYDVSGLQRVTYGGSPISPKDLQNVLEHFPETAFIQIYGQTESGVSTALMPEFHDPQGRWLSSAGRPVAGVELRIVDDAGNPAPVGVWGEICVRSPGLARGYWNRPTETAETFRDSWLHTGDIGYLDDSGFLYVVDRAKDMIITGGENVYSVEVENVLDEHPAVEESAVIGVSSERWGEEVHAIVRLQPDTTVTQDMLLQHCRQRLAAYKCPRSIVFRDEPLPRTPIGKILKRELRKET